MITQTIHETHDSAVNNLLALGFRPVKSTVYVRMGSNRASASIHQDTEGWRMIIVEPRRG